MQSVVGRRYAKNVSRVIFALGFVGSLAFAGSYTVSPTNLNGWTTYALNYDPNTGLPVIPSTATNSFVTGPSTPPLGVGSFQTSIGSDGNSYAGVSTQRYDGIALADITGLGYSTYVQQNNGAQAFYLVLELSNNDQLFMEPVYQNGGYEQVDSSGNMVSPPTYPDQCGSNCPAVNQWQNWNAAEAGWWSNQNMGGAGSGGPPVITLADYASQFPGVTITGIDIQAGAGAPSWTNFVGNIDDFYISTSTVNDVVDFEPSTATPEPASLGLIGSGLLFAAFARLRKRKA